MPPDERQYPNKEGASAAIADPIHGSQGAYDIAVTPSTMGVEKPDPQSNPEDLVDVRNYDRRTPTTPGGPRMN